MILRAKNDLLLLVFGRVATIVLALISMRTVTHFLSPDEYGQLSILFTIQMLCGLFLINPVGQYINLRTHDWWKEKSLFSRLKRYWIYILSVSILGVFILFLVVQYLSIFTSLFGVLIAIGCAIFFGTWNATLTPMLNMLGFRSTSIFIGVLSVAISLLASIGFTKIYPGPASWLLGQALGYAFGAYFAWKILSKIFTQSGQASITHKDLNVVNKGVLFQYCLPLAFATGFMWFQMSGYRFMVEKYWGLASLGFMVLGFQIASQVWGLVESLATQYLYPLFFKRVAGGSATDLALEPFSDLLNTLIPVYFVVNGALILSANALVKLLVADAYFNAIKFVLFGAGIEMCRTTVNLLANAAHVNRKTQSLGIPYMAGSISTIVCLYFCAQWNLDISWACISVFGGGVITLILMWIYMRKEIAFLVDCPRWLFATFFMVSMGVVSQFMPGVKTIFEALLHLAVTALISFVFLLLLLNNNPSLVRLTATKLQGGSN